MDEEAIQNHKLTPISFLVNFKNWPPYYKQLTAGEVETSAGSASVRIPCDIDSSWGYQL